MRKWFLGLALIIALTVPMNGQSGQSEMLTVDNTTGGVRITSSVLSGMGGCSLRLQTAQVRWSIDLSNPPTTTYGEVMEVSDTLVFTSITIARNARFIRTGSSSGTLAVQCWPQS